MTSVSKSIVPHSVRRAIRKTRIWRKVRFFRDFYHDYKRFSRWSGSWKQDNTRKTLQAYIIRYYHAVEVGLAYPDPRPGFGAGIVEELIGHLQVYSSRFAWDRHSKVALEVLRKYVELQANLGSKNIEEVRRAVERLSQAAPQGANDESEGGTVRLKRAEIFAPWASFEALVGTRHSFREYLSEKVGRDVILRAVKMAMRSPSACNRQQAKVYVLENRGLRDLVLEIQNNKRGWRDQPDKILLVTSNMEYYAGSRERYAPYIDGSLFAMTLVWSLHSLGVGTCCLNLNLDGPGSERLRAVAGLEASEVPIMLIAAGVIPDEITVPVSVRRSPEEVLEEIQ